MRDTLEAANPCLSAYVAENRSNGGPTVNTWRMCRMRSERLKFNRRSSNLLRNILSLSAAKRRPSYSSQLHVYRRYRPHL
ncbi:hypothetical protein PsorP6_011145 [Peronosclerospora sorghi]|uniref:Uncharacterized protein n=1 Tax=Peronosclerospora sorghi TaxID=230839 RepID=A0ACC0VYT1_9STRA|nr:hypothetical protein PsorP6_011145 [Peronosclerospora sorghi]